MEWIPPPATDSVNVTQARVLENGQLFKGRFKINMKHASLNVKINQVSINIPLKCGFTIGFLDFFVAHNHIHIHIHIYIYIYICMIMIMIMMLGGMGFQVKHFRGPNNLIYRPIAILPKHKEPCKT